MNFSANIVNSAIYNLSCTLLDIWQWFWLSDLVLPPIKTDLPWFTIMSIISSPFKGEGTPRQCVLSLDVLSLDPESSRAIKIGSHLNTLTKSSQHHHSGLQKPLPWSTAPVLTAANHFVSDNSCVCFVRNSSKLANFCETCQTWQICSYQEKLMMFWEEGMGWNLLYYAERNSGISRTKFREWMKESCWGEGFSQMHQRDTWATRTWRAAKILPQIC